MAKKKKDFKFTNFMDEDAINELMNEIPSVSPTKEEVDIVKNAAGEGAMIPVDSLRDYHNHTYLVMDNEDMDALAESIKVMGVILPLLVRKINEDEYEVISGHRRLFAAKKVGLEEVPCKVIEADDATADIMMVDTNLHREEILPSEKARSFDVRIKAMQEKGLIENSEGDRKYEDMLAKDIKSSRISVYRYRKLLSLIPALLDMVDAKTIPVVSGSKLASLSEDSQTAIAEALSESGKLLSAEDTDKLVLAAKTPLTKERVLAVLAGEIKPRKRTATTLPKKTQAVEKNFSSAYPSSIKALDGSRKESFIKACIEEYVKNHDSWDGIDF